jgi:hypothetical protein
MAKRNGFRCIENIQDDHGQITHVKCSECSWKVPVDGAYSADEVICDLFTRFSSHDCEEHRIGAAFRKGRQEAQPNQ